MKGKFTLLCLAVLLQCSFTSMDAQISITESDLPHAGLSVGTAVEAFPSISVGEASSEAQIWNYTSLVGESTQTVVFEEIEEDDMVASQHFPNASMKNNLLSLIGGDGDAFPIDFGGATTYYLTDNQGNVRINGVNLGLGLDSLGIDEVNLIGNPSDTFYAVGEYGDSFNHKGSYAYTFNIEVDSLPIPVPVTIELSTDRDTDIDAFGSMQFRHAVYDVLRYNENTDVNIFVGVLFFGQPIFTFIDTSFQVSSYRFYTKDKGYPLVSVNMGEDETGNFVTSIEYLAQEAPEPVAFRYDVTCLNVAFTNTSSESQSVGGPVVNTFWDFGDGNTSNQKDAVHNYEEMGTYTVYLEVIHENGLVAGLSKDVEVGCVGVGIEELPKITHTIFPNPTSDILHFDFEGDALNHIEQIVVFNPLGQQIYTINSLSDVVELDVSTWTDGVYFYALTSKDGGTIFGDRFMVQH